MTDAKPSVQWGRAVVQELVAAGIDTVCVSPGGRSTPIVVAASEHADLSVHSVLDERSAAFFALGHAKYTGEPVAIVSTSGTAGSNFHPAVIEADRSRTPLLVCTADRPPELQELGANQTIDQGDLYGDAVRWAPTVPAPTGTERDEAALRATVGMAVARTKQPVPGPVQLNVPLRKPLTPASRGEVTDETPAGSHSITVAPSDSQLGDIALDTIIDAIDEAERGLIVAGPVDPGQDATVLYRLTELTGFPLVADPLSGIRFSEDLDEGTLGGYDAYLDPAISDDWPAPDCIIRAGARPTSEHLQSLLGRHEGRHVQLDPGVEYRDPTGTTTDLLPVTPEQFVEQAGDRIAPKERSNQWRTRFETAESRYWDIIASDPSKLPAEGKIAHETIRDAPEGSTLFVSNSMPIRDADRFGQPRDVRLRTVGNRGASGIDGILSTGLGAARASPGEAVILTGDLAFYHDMNGLLSVDRCDVDATIVVVNNDGGGIFHMLPIADVDPPFTEQFKTPHGLDFADAAELYDLDYSSVTPDSFATAYEHALASDGTTIVDVSVDGGDSHDRRETFQRELATVLAK